MNAQVSQYLVHTPFGKQHPYDQEPEERFPRQPIAGKPVTLGVKALSGAQYDQVWAVWLLEGSSEEHQLFGSRGEQTPEFDLWHIELEPFKAGQRIRYTIHASGQNGAGQTIWYEFGVAEWVEYAHFVGAEKEGVAGKMLFAADANHPLIQLKILQKESGSIDLSYSEVPSLPSSSDKFADMKDGVFHLSNADVTMERGSVRLNAHAGREVELASAANLKVLFNADGKILRYAMSFHSPETEHFWGFGERFNAIDQRGNSLRNRVIDQYKRQGKRTYYPVPFFISSRGYGLWVNTDRDVIFDLAESSKEAWQIDAEAGSENSALELILMPQGMPASVVKEFTRLTGRPKMPPSWVFGLWMSSNDWNSQAEVLRQFELTHQYNIPVTVLVIEAWADEVNFYIWNDARYDLKKGSDSFKYSDFTFPAGGHWPDPKGMIEKLHADGTRLILWQIPVLKRNMPGEQLDERQNKIDEAYWIKDRLCVMEKDGEPYRVLSPWFRESLLPDFTNPRTVEWWFKQREYLVKDLGVDGFKTDGSEHIWSDTAQFSDGTTGQGRCNSFAALYLGAYDRFLETMRGKDHFLFSRAGYTGAQKHPGHWAGDEDSNWDAFRSNIRAMLNMSLCGEPFVGWDMAGFGNEPPGAELYLRSAALAVFCPIMQYHSEYNARQIPSRDRTPWNIQERSGDERVIPLFRQLTHLRMNLLPYIQYQAWLSCQTGSPLMRALPFEYPDDAKVMEKPYEYLFGEALLVSPVVDEGRDTCEVYLPEGRWRDFWTHAELMGPREMKVTVPLGRIPVYQREGSVIALNLDDTFELASDVGNQTEEYRNLSLRIFPGDGCEFKLVRKQGEVIESVHVRPEKTSGRLLVELPALNCLTEIILYMERPISVKMDGSAIEWKWSEKDKLVKFPVNPDDKPHLIEFQLHE